MPRRLPIGPKAAVRLLKDAPDRHAPVRSAGVRRILGRELSFRASGIRAGDALRVAGAARVVASGVSPKPATRAAVLSGCARSCAGPQLLSQRDVGGSGTAWSA